MILGVATLLIVLAVSYAFLNTDLLTGFAMLVNVILAGIITFNYFEPVAREVDAYLRGSFLQGYEDSFSMVSIFCLTLLGLRFITNEIAPNEIVFPSLIQQGGACLCGVMTGYLVAGFLTCVLMTIPWHENFLGYDPIVRPAAADHVVRRLVPPDRVWLALMNYASRAGFSRSEDNVFDKRGTFVLRYARFRRFGDLREALRSQSEALP